MQIMQNKIIRIIHFLNIREHITPFYKDNELLKIEQLFSYQCMLLIYKNSFNLLPRSIATLFPIIQHSHDTRFSFMNYEIQLFNSKYGRSCPSNVCITLWSTLPDETKNHPLSSYKKVLIEIFMKLYEN